MNSTLRNAPPSYNAVACSIPNAAEAAQQITPLISPNIYQPAVGPKPIFMICPRCHYRIRTKVRHRSTLQTHIVCLLLSFTLFCCWLPYCSETCRNAVHYCPNCKAYIGTYSS